MKFNYFLTLLANQKNYGQIFVPSNCRRLVVQYASNLNYFSCRCAGKIATDFSHFIPSLPWTVAPTLLRTPTTLTQHMLQILPSLVHVHAWPSTLTVMLLKTGQLLVLLEVKQETFRREFHADFPSSLPPTYHASLSLVDASFETANHI